MIRILRRWLIRLFLVLAAASLLLTLPLSWIDPPGSAFMLADRLSGRESARAPVPLDTLPVHVPLAILAAEDQNFPFHRGFDVGEIRSALEAHLDGARLRGASTLSQQTARNLYLWRHRSWVRKGLEGWMTVWLELCLPKRRLLEIYVNLAEFDRGVYGIEAAAWHYFGKPASSLTRSEAALLAASLPAPGQFDPARPGPQLTARQQWILDQMSNLGPGWVP